MTVLPIPIDLFDLPTEILIEITQSLSVLEVQQLLAIDQYNKKLGHLFRHLEYHQKETTETEMNRSEKFFKTTDSNTLSPPSEEPLDKSLIYLIEIHSWDQFDHESFQRRFQNTKNFVIVHQYYLAMDFSSLTSELCRESVFAFLSEHFPHTTVVITEPHTIFLGFGGVIDTSRLFFTEPVNSISLLETGPLSNDGQISLPELCSLSLGRVPKSMLSCFPYDKITHEIRISLTENEIEYESYDSELLSDMDPYQFKDIDVPQAKILTLEGFHEISEVRSESVKELHCLIQEVPDNEDLRFGLYALKLNNLRAMSLGMFSTRMPPVLKNLQMDSLCYLQVEGNYTLMADNTWVFPGSLNLPSLRALNIKDHPDFLDILSAQTISNLHKLQVSVFSAEDLSLLESKEFFSLQRLDYHSLDSFGYLAYPEIRAPKLTTFQLVRISGGKTLLGISSHFTFLKILQLDFKHFNYSGFDVWDIEFPSLEYLTCDGLMFDSLEKLVHESRFPELYSFSANFETEHVLNPWRVELKAPKLQNLSLTRHNACLPHQSEVIKPPIQTKSHVAINGYPNLKKLDYKDSITEMTIENCPELEMIRCTFTATKLDQLNCVNLPKLRYLDLYGCTLRDYIRIENFQGVNVNCMKRNILNCGALLNGNHNEDISKASDIDMIEINSVKREFDHFADGLKYPELPLQWNEIMEECLKDEYKV